MVDTTERGLAEEKFRLAVEACPNGMVMFDGDGTMVMVNAEIEQQFGHRREDLIGHSVDMLVPLRLRIENARDRAAFNRSPKIRQIGVGPDFFGLRKDGSEFSVEVGLTPIRTVNDPLILGVIVDVSERKRMERLKDEFVATVSHELRTPLTSISGSLGLLLGKWPSELPPLAARLLTIAHQNSQRLVRLVNDILDIEKIEAGRVVFNLSRVDVCSLVDQAIEGNRGFAEAYGVHVRLNPASPESAVNVDPDRLAQVVTNLLSNAVKFSLAGQEVVVTVEKNCDVVRVSVQDHGSGVPADFKPHVFEKFAQSDATNSRQKGGTGLGLSIVKQIVEQLGGKVDFDDVPGGGTVFHVDLPTWESTVGREVDLEAELGAMRILLCEGDRGIADTIRVRLRRAGFITDFAHTMATAVERAEANSYEAILVDLPLPDGDGMSFILRLRAQSKYHDTPIIVVSGGPTPGVEDVRSSKLNVLDWLSKPVDLEHLAQVLRASIPPKTNTRPRILHVDDEHDVLAIVTATLGTTVDVVSVDSIEGARRVLATDRFDLVILDIVVGLESGLDLLPTLRDSEKNLIPVIIFSAQDAGPACNEQIQVALTKSQASLENLLSMVRNRLVRPTARP